MFANVLTMASAF